MEYRPCHILLVEDNKADAAFFHLVAGETNPRIAIQTVEDGAAALDYLHGRGEYEGAPRCGLIVLDLKLPGMDGLDLLRKLKSDSSVAYIPVVVFSSSIDPADVARAYSAGANAYVQKKFGADGMYDSIRAFVKYWLNLVTLPDPAPW